MSEIVLFLILITISAVFTGVEAALLSLSTSRVRHFARQQSGAALRLEELLEQPHRLLLSILVITNACNICALAILVQISTQYLGAKGYVIAGLAAVPLWLVVIGVVPKGLFRRMPFRTLSALVQPLEICTRLLDPITKLFERVASPLVEVSAGRRYSSGAARDELKFFAEASEAAGDLSPIERAMIHDVLDFRSLNAETLMIPWADVVSVPIDAAHGEIVRIARERNLDRLPVVDHDGRVVGLVLTLDLLLEGDGTRTARNFLRHIVSVQRREPAHKIIRRMRAARITMAVVLSETGAPLGIVASEDLIARLVQTASSTAPASGPPGAN
jgi:putative hemolysin